MDRSIDRQPEEEEQRKSDKDGRRTPLHTHTPHLGRVQQGLWCRVERDRGGKKIRLWRVEELKVEWLDMVVQRVNFMVTEPEREQLSNRRYYRDEGGYSEREREKMCVSRWQVADT